MNNRKFWMTLVLVCLFGIGAKGAVRVMTISGESFSLTAETATGNGSYFYRFQGCNATATYSEASGCTVTFNGKSTITGIRRGSARSGNGGRGCRVFACLLGTDKISDSLS